MTGPEHYQEAERLLATAYEDNLTAYEGENPAAARQIAEAQVHATLALAAATAAQDSVAGTTHADCKAWTEAAITPEPDYDVTESFA